MAARRNWKFDNPETAVKETLMTRWLSGKGGISDREYQRISEQLIKYNGYTWDEIEQEFDRQMTEYCRSKGVKI